MKKLNDNDVSNWVPSAEETVLDDLECQDPFAHRKVGITEVPWKNKKCPSCRL